MLPLRFAQGRNDGAWVILLMAVAVLSVSGQAGAKNFPSREVSDSPWSLSQVVALGESRSLELVRARREAAVAKARFVEAARKLLPSVQAKLDMVEGTVAAGPFASRSHGFEFEQAVPLGGKLWAEVAKARLGLGIAQAKIDQARLNKALEVGAAFWSLWLAGENLGSFEGILKESERVRSLVKREASAGLISPLELSRSLSVCDQLLYEKVALEQSARLAEIGLRDALGLEPWRAVGVEPPRSLPVLDATLPEYLASAYASRPDWKAARLALRQSRETRSAARWEALPTVSLIGSVGRGGEVLKPDEPDPDREWAVGFRVGWQLGGSSVSYERMRDQRADVFSEARSLNTTSHRFRFGVLDRLDFFTRLAEAQAGVAQGDLDLEDLKYRIAAEVEAAFFEFQKALVAWEGAKSALAYRETELAYTRELLERGRAGAWDLLEAVRDLERARASQREAFAKAHEASFKLNSVTGNW